MGRVLLYILLAATFIGGSTGYVYATPPAWYGDDIQKELPLFETASIADEFQAADAPLESCDGSTNGEGCEDTESIENTNPVDNPDVYEGNTENFDDAPVDANNEFYDDAPLDENSDFDDYEESTEYVVPRQGIEGPRPPKTDVDPPDWLVSLSEWLKSIDGPDLDVIPILKALGIGLLVVLGLIILATIFRRLRTFELPETTSKPKNALDDLRKITDSVPHQELAGASQWDVAIHALLLDALTKIAPRFPIVESPDITCREIASHIETNHGPLTELVGISESCVFALIVATEDQYNRAITLHAQILGGSR